MAECLTEACSHRWIFRRTFDFKILDRCRQDLLISLWPLQIRPWTWKRPTFHFAYLVSFSIKFAEFIFIISGKFVFFCSLSTARQSSDWRIHFHFCLVLVRTRWSLECKWILPLLSSVPYSGGCLWIQMAEPVVWLILSKPLCSFILAYLTREHLWWLAPGVDSVSHLSDRSNYCEHRQILSLDWQNLSLQKNSARHCCKHSMAAIVLVPYSCCVQNLIADFYLSVSLFSCFLYCIQVT